MGKKIIDKMEGKAQSEPWRKRKREQQLYRETGREAWRKRKREQQLCIGKGEGKHTACVIYIK